MTVTRRRRTAGTRFASRIFGNKKAGSKKIRLS